MKTFFINLSFAALVTTLAFTSCSKKDNPGSSGKKAKVTITLSNTFSKAEGDYFTATVTANNSSGATVDWLVNGTRQTGTAITIGTDDFNGGKTIILESAGDFYVGLVKMGGFEFGATPFAVSYKVEVNGAIKDQGNETLVKNQDPLFSKNIQL